MAKIGSVFRIFRNGYLLIGVAAVVWLVFFDRYNVIATFRAYYHIKELEKELAFFEGEQARIQQEGILNEGNLEALDILAREKFFMHRDDEDVFVVMDQSQLDKYKVEVEE